MTRKHSCEACSEKILDEYEGHGAVLVRKLSPLHRYWLCPMCALYGAVMNKKKKKVKRGNR